MLSHEIRCKTGLHLGTFPLLPCHRRDSRQSDHRHRDNHRPKVLDMDADDVAMVSNNAEDLRNALHSFQSEAINLGLTFSWQKTKIQVLNKSGNGTPPPHFMVNGQSVDVVEDFINLGSQISNFGRCEPDVLRRLGLASSAINKLHRFWKLKRLNCATKLAIS